MPSRHELIQWGTIRVVGGGATLIVGIYVFGQILNVMPQPETVSFTGIFEIEDLAEVAEAISEAQAIDSQMD